MNTEYKKIQNKKVNELTIEDKKIIVKYELKEAYSNFSSALSYASELDYRFINDCLEEAKMMVDEAEELAI